MNPDKIKGGSFQVARKLFEGDLWLNKPSSWKVIWIYILGRVNHQKDQYHEKGEGFFQWTKEQSRIGADISQDMIKKSSRYFKQNQMIDTKRSTRGVTIKVLNYDTYQTFDNYSSTRSGTKKALEKHLESTTIDKNVKNVSYVTAILAETSSAKFSLKEYIKKLEESPRRDMNIIALYFEEKKPDIQNVEQARVAVRRHLRAAKELTPFTDNQILSAIPKAKSLTSEWTCETLVKCLTK